MLPNRTFVKTFRRHPKNVSQDPHLKTLRGLAIFLFIRATPLLQNPQTTNKSKSSEQQASFATGLKETFFLSLCFSWAQC